MRVKGFGAGALKIRLEVAFRIHYVNATVGNENPDSERARCVEYSTGCEFQIFTLSSGEIVENNFYDVLIWSISITCSKNFDYLEKVLGR